MLSLAAATSCLGRGEPAPDPLTGYLENLRSGRIAAAYAQTQLGELDAFSQGGALSAEHFAAFYRADPVSAYEIVRVVRLDRRAPDNLGEQGTPEWDVEVRLTHRTGPVETTFGILGEVLAKINVVPVALDLAVSTDVTPHVEVDGVEVDLSRAGVGEGGNRWRLVVIEGRHTLTVDDRTVVFDAEPLRVVRGSATVQRGPVGGLSTLRVGT